MYIYLRFYLYVYSCIECVEIFIFGGGGMPFKKINCCLFVKKLKKYKEEKNATVKFYVM